MILTKGVKFKLNQNKILNQKLTKIIRIFKMKTRKRLRNL